MLLGHSHYQPGHNDLGWAVTSARGALRLDSGVLATGAARFRLGGSESLTEWPQALGAGGAFVSQKGPARHGPAPRQGARWRRSWACSEHGLLPPRQHLVVASKPRPCAPGGGPGTYVTARTCSRGTWAQQPGQTPPSGSTSAAYHTRHRRFIVARAPTELPSGYQPSGVPHAPLLDASTPIYCTSTTPRLGSATVPSRSARPLVL
jgi:hypothetical protein